MAMTLRLTDEEDQALSDLASALHVSKQEAAVRAIQESWTRHGVAAEVEDFADHALRRYRDLLDRLAQ
jgi:predicted transcriptional regulator